MFFCSARVAIILQVPTNYQLQQSTSSRLVKFLFFGRCFPCVLPSNVMAKNHRELGFSSKFRHNSKHQKWPHAPRLMKIRQTVHDLGLGHHSSQCCLILQVKELHSSMDCCRKTLCLVGKKKHGFAVRFSLFCPMPPTFS